MPSTKSLTRLSAQHKQDSSQIPTPTSHQHTTTTENTLAATPSIESVAVQFRIYQPPLCFRGWADSRDLEPPLRHLGLLDVARFKLLSGVPRPYLVSDLISSYDPKQGCGYLSGIRVNVDRKSFLRAVSLHPTTERRDLPPNMLSSTVTRAAEQFINMCLRVQWLDMLPTVSAAMQKVKAGSAHTVDWGKLMWDLVENEILELPKRDDKVSCFGVYLQRLIWVQLPFVFEICELVDAAVKKEMVKFLPALKAAVEVEMVKLKERGIQVGLQQPQLVNNPSNLVESEREASEVLEVQQQPMEVQRSQLASTPSGGKMHIEGHSDHMEAQQRLQLGNHHKRARNDNNCGVPTGSAIAIANSSHDIVEIERTVNHATSEELR